MLKVYIDGACEPINPGGTASYGLIVYRDDTKILVTGKVIGTGALMSNNVAEYAGLLAFLKRWGGVNPVEVFSDSQLVCKQMAGEWQARRGLYLESYHQAKTLCDGKPISFHWIPREQNTEADRCSIVALAAIGIIRR